MTNTVCKATPTQKSLTADVSFRQVYATGAGAAFDPFRPVHDRPLPGKSRIQQSARATRARSCAKRCPAARHAIRFYERCFPGKILFELTWGESPLAKDVPHTWAEKICHSTLMVGDTTFHGVDLLPGTYEPPRGFSIVLDIDDVAGADHLFGVLGENGEVHVPLQETFWARRYGKVVDRFGIAWEISCGRPPAQS